MQYLVSKDTFRSKKWYVSTRRPNVSATVWETITELGFHKTARAAREALERRESSPVKWSKHIGRGSAYYKASVT